MRSKAHTWWLLVLIAAAGITAAAGLGRRTLVSWTRRRWLEQCQAQLAALPQQRAARLVPQLADADLDGLPLLIAACSDRRQAVADSAARSSQALAERWSQLPPAEAAPRVAALAGLLAQQAPQMAPAQQEVARSLAKRLIDWPIDSRQIDLPQFIADCEAVLRLPASPPEELRLAAIPPPQPPAASATIESPAIVQPQVASPPALIAPPIRKETGPALTDAQGQERAEPKRLAPPKALRISDE
jgi:hypothetical protein